MPRRQLPAGWTVPDADPSCTWQASEHTASGETRERGDIPGEHADRMPVRDVPLPTYIALCQLQAHLMLPHHPPQIQDGVAHTSQTGIDADPCRLGNFLERHLLVETHEHDLAL